MKYLPLVIMVTLAYLIGNISPATLIGRFYGIDIKKLEVEMLEQLMY